MSLQPVVSNTGIGPKFIFGRLNPKWRASTGGDDAATREVLADLTARLQKRLGHKPSPRQLQDAFRRQLMANVRGRMLAQLAEANGGKAPSVQDFRAAMDRWRERNLVDQMAAVNKALGTKGTGFPGGGVHPPRRAGWQRRLQSAIEAATKASTSTSGSATKPRPYTGTVAPDARADFNQNDRTSPNRNKAGYVQFEDGSWGKPYKAAELNLRSLADRAAGRVQRRLRSFLDDQRTEIAKRLEARADQVSRKPGDASLWWDGEKWDSALERILAPVAEALADVAADRVSAALEPAGKATLGELAGKTALERLLGRVGLRIKGINETTRREIVGIVRAGVAEGVSMAELGRRIRESTAFDDNRAETIARTETGTALNQAQLESYREFKVEKVRVLDGDGDAACANANGSIWTLDEASSAPLGHPNCTRDFAPVVGSEKAEMAPMSLSDEEGDDETFDDEPAPAAEEPEPQKAAVGPIFTVPQITIPLTVQHEAADMGPIAEVLRQVAQASEMARLENAANHSAMKAWFEHFEVPAPIVNVDVAAQPAPVVNVAAPPPIVVPAPIVNVEQPAEKAAIVQDIRIVDMPTRTSKSLKKVKRDDRGLIKEILETTVDE